MLLTLFFPIYNKFLLSWVGMSDFPWPWLPWMTCWAGKWAFTCYLCMQNYISCLSPWGMVWPLAAISLFQDLQNVLRTIKITFYLYFFSFFRLCKNNCFKACNTERWWREDKNRKRDNSTAPNPHMLREICTKPCANTACPSKQGPIKDLGAQNWTHPILPISSENSGGQYNPGLRFTLMNKQKHRSGESINEYSWLNKTPTSLCYQWQKHEENMKNVCRSWDKGVSFSFLSYQEVACMGLNRAHREKSNDLDTEKKLRPVSRAASADTWSVCELPLATEKEENPVSSWQLMTLFIFYNPTEHRSARTNIQLPNS